MFVPNAAIVQVIVEYLTDGIEWTNTLYFQSSAPIDVPKIDTVLNAVENHFVGNIASILSSSTSVTKLTGYSMASDTAPKSERTLSPPVQGSRAGSAAPLQDAATITLNTGNRGRSGRGRHFVSGLREADLGVTEVEAVFLTDLVNTYDNILTAFAGVPILWGVYSRYSGGLPRATGLFQPIIGVSVSSPKIKTQRRRLGS
mgnify:CR=1 FL=1